MTSVFASATPADVNCEFDSELAEWQTFDETPSPRLPNATLTRAERTVLDAVDRALAATGYLNFRNLHVSLGRGQVVLNGVVPTYHQKQLAQAAALQAAGYGRVENRIEVACRR